MSNPPIPSYPNTPGWSRWIERLRGVTAGRFTIIRELGRGGFAAVFLAQQLQPNRRVAIKLLLPTHLESKWALEHFRGESQKIAEWRHQSVVTIYEVHEVDDLFFFVMSYVEGGSLHDLIQSLGPLSIPAARSILAQMGSALQYAHRQGVTHRDIKPQNVLVDTDGGAVVTDFGIAKQSGGTSHTVTGMLFGTPPYMAPEQCESGATSIASDQYSLGIVAYEMLTGSPPFTGHVTTVLMAHLMEPVPSVRAARPECPEELDAAIMRMLAKKPEDRFPSIGEAMQAAGAAELPDFHPERRKLAEAAKEAATKAHATVVDILSIPPRIEVGERIALDATARTLTGDAISFGDSEWSVDNTVVANLDAQTGLLTALQPGVATLLVKSGGTEQLIRVDVVQPKVASLEVTGPVNALKVGERTQLHATAKSKSGTAITSSAKWTSDNPALVTVMADGTLLAQGAGRTLIRAQVDDVSSELWVEVAAPKVADVRITNAPVTLTVGDHRQLSTVVLDESDHTMTGAVVQWTSSDRKVATVSSTGLVTAIAAGSVTISATIDGQTTTQAIAVEAQTAVQVEVVKPPGGINVGDRMRLRAIGRDAVGNAVDRPVTWSSTDTAIATVAGDGTVSAITGGSVRITATIDGVSGSVSLHVSKQSRASGPLQAVADAPAAAAPRAATSAPVRSQGKVRIIAIRLGGVAIAATAVFLVMKGGGNSPASVGNASAPLAAKSDSVPTQGASTGGAPVTASPPAQQQNVAPPASPPTNPNSASPSSVGPRSISVVPLTRPLVVGDSATLTVRVSDGSPASAVRWTSPDRARASVSPSGVIHALAEGVVSVIARSGAMYDTVRITIAPKAVAASAPPTQTQSTPPATTTPPVNRDSAPPPVTRPPADAGASAAAAERAAADAAVKKVVSDFAAAMTAHKVDDMVKLFPTMLKRDQDLWKNAFKDLKDFAADYTVQNVALDRGEGSVRVSGIHRYTNDKKKQCALPMTIHMTVAQTSGAWRITSMQQTPNGTC